MFINKDKRCEDCIFADYNDESNKGCGIICKLNPFKPVHMGYSGKHAHRKENKKEQYSK